MYDVKHLLAQSRLKSQHRQAQIKAEKTSNMAKDEGQPRMHANVDNRNAWTLQKKKKIEWQQDAKSSMGTYYGNAS